MTPRKSMGGAFEPLGPLGRGGWAEVYAGRRRGWVDQLVAHKYLRDGVGAEPAARRRFRREAEIGLSLAHPNVVCTRGVTQVDGEPVLVMDLVGPSVHAMRSEVIGDYPAVRWILREALNALAYIEREGIAHRDLSPANLLIDPRGRIRLCDFGVATRYDGSATPGPLGGTYPYCSPELLRGERGTSASDRWSLGVIAYELLTGQLPFGESLQSVVEGHARGTPRFPRGVPKDLRAVTLGLLALDPAARLRVDEALALLARRDHGAAARLGHCSRSWFRTRFPGVTHPLDGVATYASAVTPSWELGPARSSWRIAVPVMAAVTTAACAGAWIVMDDRESQPDAVAAREPVTETVEPDQSAVVLQPDPPVRGLAGGRWPKTADSRPNESKGEIRLGELKRPVPGKPWLVEYEKAAEAGRRHASKVSITAEAIQEAKNLAQEVYEGDVQEYHISSGGGIQYRRAHWRGNSLVVTIRPKAPFVPTVAFLEAIEGRFTTEDSHGWVEVIFSGARTVVDTRANKVGVVFVEDSGAYLHLNFDVI